MFLNCVKWGRRRARGLDLLPGAGSKQAIPSLLQAMSESVLLLGPIRLAVVGWTLFCFPPHGVGSDWINFDGRNAIIYIFNSSIRKKAMKLLCYYLTQLNPYIYTNTIIVPNETITIVCNSGDAKYQHDPNKSHYCEAKLEILDRKAFTTRSRP